MEKPIDVVVPVRNEFDKLALCCRALRASVPIHNLIIPTANASAVGVKEVSKLADIPIFDESVRGAGATRALGLNAVETEFYGSIDADVVISPKWYDWCINKIQQPSVGACQGYQKPIGKLCDRWYESLMLRRGHCDQGNTLLRTQLVRDVGMPVEIQSEDALLRERFAQRGYAWIVNPNLVSTHIQSDLEFFSHWYSYGSLEPMDAIQFSKYIVWLVRWSLFQTKVDTLEMAYLGFLLNFTRALGSLMGDVFSKYPSSKTSPGPSRRVVATA